MIRQPSPHWLQVHGQQPQQAQPPIGRPAQGQSSIGTIPAGVQPQSNGPMNQGFQRVSPGIYRGPNGQTVKSAMNPGAPATMPKTPLGGAMPSSMPGMNPGSFVGQAGMQPPAGQPSAQFNPGSAYGQYGSQAPMGGDAYNNGNAYGNAQNQQINSVFGALANQNQTAGGQYQQGQPTLGQPQAMPMGKPL